MKASMYDDNVARLAAMHPAIFGRGVPGHSDLKTGWYGIVDKLCSDIERELTPELASLFAIDQIKEKFGTLRFYWHLGGQSDLHVGVFGLKDTAQSSDRLAEHSRAANAKAVDLARDRLRKLVNAACRTSATTCERCGALGSLRPLAWVKTLCDEHFRDVAKRNAKGMPELVARGASGESDESSRW